MMSPYKYLCAGNCTVFKIPCSYFLVLKGRNSYFQKNHAQTLILAIQLTLKSYLCFFCFPSIVIFY